MDNMNYLKTPFGNIKIKIENNEAKYIIYELIGIYDTLFDVDARYKLLLETSAYKNCNNIVIECLIDGLRCDDINIETGEDLELISFYINNTKLSIGIESIENINYIYTKNGIKFECCNENIKSQFIFGVAWKVINSENEDVFTWFAADPNLFNENDILT
jgi:hypothetical protein